MTDEEVADRIREDRDEQYLKPTTEERALARRESAEPLELIARAIEKGFDTEQLGKLMDLQERYEKRKAEVAYNQAMSWCQAEMSPIARDAQNSHTKSMFARLESIVTKITPVYTKHGFCLSFDNEQSPLAGHLRIRCDVRHSGGHTQPHRIDIPMDGQGTGGKTFMTPTQATGSTNSYARRYIQIAIFNLAIANEDNDGIFGGNEVVTPEQIAEINDLIAECEAVGNPVHFGRFLGWLNVPSLDELPASDFTKAVHELNRKRREKKNGGAK